MGKRTLGLLLLIVAAAVAAQSQQTTNPSQGTDPTGSSRVSRSTEATQSPQPTPTPMPDYVFPTHGERFRHYVKSTVGPFRLARTAVSAGLSQWRDTPEEWGQGAQGYGKRYASSFGSNAIHQTVTYALDEALHLDSGFKRSKREGFFPRLKDALIQNVTSRTTSGNRVFSAPRLAGYYAGGIVPKVTWYPERYSYKDGLRSGTKSLLTGFGINVFREFVFNF